MNLDLVCILCPELLLRTTPALRSGWPQIGIQMVVDIPQGQILVLWGSNCEIIFSNSRRESTPRSLALQDSAWFEPRRLSSMSLLFSYTNPLGVSADFPQFGTFLLSFILGLEQVRNDCLLNGCLAIISLKSHLLSFLSSQIPTAVKEQFTTLVLFYTKPTDPVSSSGGERSSHTRHVSHNYVDLVPGYLRTGL